MHDHVGEPHPSAHSHSHDPEATGHAHGQQHAHDEPAGPFAWLAGLRHRHDHAPELDSALAASDAGIRAIWLSLVGLGLTAGIQLVIALSSGSVGLLADTIHNFSDALTAIPLWLAFVVGRWPASRRFTYGYGRAEDVAGVLVVLIVLTSALLAAWEAYRRLVRPAPIPAVGWVMAAAVVGFLGNELVSVIRIRTGRRIGSAALEADGQHARVDGLTSLAVLLGALAVWLGFPIADPIVGLFISAAILWVTKDAALVIGHRLLDAVDPVLVHRLEHAAEHSPGVEGVDAFRVRWVGHRLWAQLRVRVDEDTTLTAAHAIAEDVRHRLFHAEPRLSDVSVHVDPCGHSGVDHHELMAHHRDER
jgi:cation diffusion facilitator family transporter